MQTDSQRIPLMRELTGKAGFASSAFEKKFSRRRNAVVELLATVGLAASLIIAATAVSIGVARAQPPAAVSGSGSAPMPIAMAGGLVVAGAGGLTAMSADERQTIRP
jgi:hypothetical protein